VAWVERGNGPRPLGRPEPRPAPHRRPAPVAPRPGLAPLRRRPLPSPSGQRLPPAQPPGPAEGPGGPPQAPPAGKPGWDLRYGLGGHVAYRALQQTAPQSQQAVRLQPFQSFQPNLPKAAQLNTTLEEGTPLDYEVLSALRSPADLSEQWTKIAEAVWFGKMEKGAWWPRILGGAPRSHVAPHPVPVQLPHLVAPHVPAPVVPPVASPHVPTPAVVPHVPEPVAALRPLHAR
jgi:hypothetical protein